MISDIQGWQDIKAISAYHDHQIALKQDGTVLVNGNFAFGARIVSGWKDIIAISSGYTHVVGLKSDGTVVAARNYPDNEALNTGTISVDKKIVKPSDTINISLKNNGAYNIQDNQIQLLHGDSIIFDGQMDVKSENERAFSYVVKPSDYGHIDIKFPHVFDLFGNNEEKQNAFQVIPLQSVESSKSQTKAGEKITLTATFYQSVKPDFTIDLSGGADLQGSQMKEVEGSNGTKYTLDYCVPSNYTEGQVDVTLKKVTTADGTIYDSYTEKAVFSKANKPLPIQSLTASKALGKIDDKITITANFSESVKPGVQITLEGENFTLPSVSMTEVTGSKGTKYVYTYPVAVNFNGKMSARITNAYDQNGSLYKEYQQANLFEADAAPPYVVGMEATPKNPKIGDKVLITATFTEPVKPTMKLLIGDEEFSAVNEMKEVTGSNGTKFSYEYTIEENAKGPFGVYLWNIEDLAGNKYSGINRDGKFYAYNLFTPDGVRPTITSLVSDKKVYEAGDVASFTATFSEPVKPGVKIKLTGALNQEYEMTQVDSKTFEFYYVIPSGGTYGNVNMELNFEDLVGNTNQFSQSNALFISNPSNARLSGISIKSGTQEYPLTPGFSPDVSEYHLTIYGTVTNVNVGATTEDSNTSVTGVGNASIKTGDNVIVLTSTSKDGTEKAYKVIVTVKSPLSMPINVKAVSDSYNSVKLSWNAVGDASGYEIYRSTSSSGPFTKMATTISTMYTNTSLNTGTTYYYKVLAYKAGIPTASSDFSSMVSAKPIPVPPTSVTAASSSFNSLRINWGAVSGASGYEIYRATSSTGTYSLVGTTTSTSFVNGGLATNYSYYYKIRAYKTVGSMKVYSDFSTIVSAKPIPATPTGVKATSSSYNGLKISWVAVSGVSGYEVYRATSSSGSYSLIGTTTSTSLTNTGLTTNRLYFYKLKAYRMVGKTKVYGNYSAVVSAKSVPSVPTNFKAARLNSTSVKLTWSPVLGANGYELYRSTTSSGTYSLVKSTTSTSYTNSGLVRGRIYYYKVRAYRTVGTTKVYSGWTLIISGKAY
ncbi:fibronectin type III domain-containing protein [Neobacillus drentensis]|uniref:fibronectin type III domain-containing protein n=1 Tax=Neobacillus drentensis TaxID=220684 RepID=UPI003D2F947C